MKIQTPHPGYPFGLILYVSKMIKYQPHLIPCLTNQCCEAFEARQKLLDWVACGTSIGTYTSAQRTQGLPPANRKKMASK